MTTDQGHKDEALAEPLLTLHELATEWGVCDRTILRLVGAGKLRCIRIGRQLRFRREDKTDYERRNRSK